LFDGFEASRRTSFPAVATFKTSDKNSLKLEILSSELLMLSVKSEFIIRHSISFLIILRCISEDSLYANSTIFDKSSIKGFDLLFFHFEIIEESFIR
jgi:hypothetical protein